MNGSDAGGDKPDQHFDGRAGELHCGNRDWGDGGAQSVCHGLSGKAMSNKWSLPLNLAKSIDVNPTKKHMSLVRIRASCCADTDEVVNKSCFAHWVWGARHIKTVFATAVGELIIHLWRFAMESSCDRPKCFNLPYFVHAPKLWEMSAHRWRNRCSGYVLQHGCHQKHTEFDVCFTCSTWILVQFPAVRRVHCPTSRWRQCSAAAVLQKLFWTEYVAFTSRCRRDHLAPRIRESFSASADSLFLSSHFRSSWTLWCQWSLGDFSNLRSYTSSGIGEKCHEKRIVCAVYAFQLVLLFSIDTVGPTFNFEGLRLE